MSSNSDALEPGRLVEDQVRDAELAQVVEQACPPDVDDGGGRQAHGQRKLLGDRGHAARVRSGERALGVDDVGERRGDPVDVRVVGQADAAAGLERERPRREVGGEQVVEQSAGAGVEQRVDDVRVVPRPAPFGEDADRRPPGRGSRRRCRGPGRPPGSGPAGRSRRRAGRAAGRRRPSARGGRGSRRRRARRSRPCGRSTAPRSQRSCSIWCCSRVPVRPIADQPPDPERQRLGRRAGSGS